MMRSAKMNDTTPPKLIPPFHSTAASGTLPIEHTKLSRLTTGPMSGPHTFDSTGWPTKKKCRQNDDRHPRRQGPGHEQPDDDVADATAAHSMTKMWETA